MVARSAVNSLSDRLMTASVAPVLDPAAPGNTGQVVQGSRTKS
jgi:hypothetical protein